MINSIPVSGFLSFARFRRSDIPTQFHSVFSDASSTQIARPKHAARTLLRAPSDQTGNIVSQRCWFDRLLLTDLDRVLVELCNGKVADA